MSFRVQLPCCSNLSQFERRRHPPAARRSSAIRAGNSSEGADKGDDKEEEEEEEEESQAREVVLIRLGISPGDCRFRVVQHVIVEQLHDDTGVVPTRHNAPSLRVQLPSSLAAGTRSKDHTTNPATKNGVAPPGQASHDAIDQPCRNATSPRKTDVRPIAAKAARSTAVRAGRRMAAWSMAEILPRSERSSFHVVGRIHISPVA